MPYLIYTVYGDNCVLYVGRTKNLRKRMFSHRRASPWFSLATYIEWSDFIRDKFKASVAESTQISHKLPIFNVYSKVRRVDYLDYLYAKEERNKEMRRLRANGWKLEDLAKKYNLTKQRVHQLTKDTAPKKCPTNTHPELDDIFRDV